MARLQYDRALMQFPQRSEEILCEALFEKELRRKLDEHGSQFVTESAH